MTISFSKQNPIYCIIILLISLLIVIYKGYNLKALISVIYGCLLGFGSTFNYISRIYASFFAGRHIFPIINWDHCGRDNTILLIVSK